MQTGAARQQVSTARIVTAIGLLLGAMGIVVLDASGVAFPKIPPGLIIQLAAAAVVAFVAWRWAPAVGALVALFITVGFVASGSIPHLTGASRPGVMVGTWVQLVGLLTGLVGGVWATVAGSPSAAASG